MLSLRTYLGPIPKQFQSTFYCKKCGEEKVEVTQDIHEEERGIVVLQHQGESVENDEQEDEVFKRRRRDKAPCVVPRFYLLASNIHFGKICNGA